MFAMVLNQSQRHAFTRPPRPTVAAPRPQPVTATTCGGTAEAAAAARACCDPAAKDDVVADGAGCCG